MSFDEAIGKKYICDYRITLPSIYYKNERLDEELSIYGVPITIQNKCRFLLTSLLDTGARKYINYSHKKDKIPAFIEALGKMHEHNKYEYDVREITGEIESESEGKEILGDSYYLVVVF